MEDISFLNNNNYDEFNFHLYHIRKSHLFLVKIASHFIFSSLHPPPPRFHQPSPLHFHYPIVNLEFHFLLVSIPQLQPLSFYQI
jgi:hypothetical protein